MDLDTHTYKRVRLLTGLLTPVLFSALLLAFALHRDGWEPGAQAAGICRELLAGSTEGRQALFGSCWVAPLPVLLYLPFAWLFAEPYAGCAAFFAAWLFVFWSVREAVKATGPSGGRVFGVQAALAALVAVVKQPQMLQVATALTLGLVLLTVSGLADWVAYRRMRDVVATGTAGAFLALCGFSVFAPAALAVGLLPFAACGHRESRARFWAWALLGGLPLVYAVGVWVLLNRLVLGDPLFFVRSLEHLVPHVAVFLLAVFAPVVAVLPGLSAAWKNERFAQRPGAGNAAATVLLIGLAVMLFACAAVLGAFGVGWGRLALYVGVLAVMVIALARLRQPSWRLALSLSLVVGFGMFWFGPRAPRVDAESSGRQVCGDVEAYVQSRTPYGRVFVLGYAGLDLLRGYTGERLVPNLDLHVGALRRAYKGQVLYVLVPEPKGVVRAESVFWRFPDIYELGCDRLLFAEKFGSWHLFEVIGAPTQEQLNEWKKAR